MSAKITAGVYVAAKKPVGVLGWWIGKVLEGSENGFIKVKIVWSENPDAYSQTMRVCVWNGSVAKNRSIVGFCTAKQAFRYMIKRRRASDFDSQFAQ